MRVAGGGRGPQRRVAEVAGLAGVAGVGDDPDAEPGQAGEDAAVAVFTVGFGDHLVRTAGQPHRRREPARHHAGHATGRGGPQRQFALVLVLDERLQQREGLGRGARRGQQHAALRGELRPPDRVGYVGPGDLQDAEGLVEAVGAPAEVEGTGQRDTGRASSESTVAASRSRVR